MMMYVHHIYMPLFSHDSLTNKKSNDLDMKDIKPEEWGISCIHVIFFVSGKGWDYLYLFRDF